MMWFWQSHLLPLRAPPAAAPLLARPQARRPAHPCLLGGAAARPQPLAPAPPLQKHCPSRTALRRCLPQPMQLGCAGAAGW